jgi:PAS domain S-box-containing protein
MSFVVMILFAAMWEITDFFAYARLIGATNIDVFLRLSGVFWIFLPFLVLNFVYTIASRKRDVFYYFIFLFGFVFTIYNIFSTNLILGFKDLEWGYKPLVGPLFFAFSAVSIFIPILFSIYLLLLSKNVQVIRKNRLQMRFFAAGLILSLILATLSNYILPEVIPKGEHPPQIGSALVIFHSIFSFWAIVKYDFLAIDINKVTHEVFSTISDLVIITDSNGEIIDLNQSAKRVFKDENSSIEGTHITKILGEDYDYHRDFFSRELSLEAHGKTFYMNLSQNSYIRNNVVRGKVILLRDVSKIKKAEKDNVNLIKTLNSKNKELQSFVYITTHDFRSPLVNIQGFGNELSDACNRIRSEVEVLDISEESKKGLFRTIDVEIKEAIEFIIGSTNKMDNLLNGLYTVAQVGKVLPQLKKIDMNKMLHSIVEGMEYQIREKGILIQIGVIHPCIGDELQINQVFTNLIDNAIKYLDPDKKGVIELTCEKKENTVTYSVIDNGIGISEDEQDKIFVIFHRLDPESDVQGDGLGLTIVKKILDLNSGEVSLCSDTGQGSQFNISLPSA